MSGQLQKCVNRTSDDKDIYDQNGLLALLLFWDSSVKLTVHKRYILFKIYQYQTLRPYLGVVYAFSVLVPCGDSQILRGVEEFRMWNCVLCTVL